MNATKGDELLNITYNELHKVFEQYNNELLEECNKHMKIGNVDVGFAIQMNRNAISELLCRIKSFVYKEHEHGKEICCNTKR